MHRRLPPVLKPEPNIALPLKQPRYMTIPEVRMPVPRLIALPPAVPDLSAKQSTNSIQTINESDENNLPAKSYYGNIDADVNDLSNLTQSSFYDENSSSCDVPPKGDLADSSRIVRERGEYEVVIHDSLTDDDVSMPPLVYQPTNVVSSESGQIRKSSVTSSSVAGDVMGRFSITSNTIDRSSVARGALLTRSSMTDDIIGISSIAGNALETSSATVNIMERSSIASDTIERSFVSDDVIGRSSAAGDIIGRSSVTGDFSGRSSIEVIGQSSVKERAPIPIVSDKPIYTVQDHQNSVQLEGNMLKNVSIPNMFAEVMDMQKCQNDEIGRQMTAYKNVQKRLEVVSEANIKLREELSSVVNNIYLTQESAKAKEKSCKHVKKEITDLVSECESLKSNTEEQQQALAERERELEDSIYKMTNYKQRVEEFESSTDLMVHLQQQEAVICDLRKSSEENSKQDIGSMLDGSIEIGLKDTITQLTEDIKLQQDFLQEKNTVIHNLQVKRKQVAQNTSVLHKKNAAQLTRLKRQLKEVHVRNRRWNDQIEQLHTTINELNQKLID